VQRPLQELATLLLRKRLAAGLNQPHTGHLNKNGQYFSFDVTKFYLTSSQVVWSKLHQIRFRLGLRPRTHRGSLRRSPRSPSRLAKGDTPSSYPSPRRLRHLDLDACGV